MPDHYQLIERRPNQFVLQAPNGESYALHVTGCGEGLKVTKAFDGAYVTTIDISAYINDVALMEELVVSITPERNDQAWMDLYREAIPEWQAIPLGVDVSEHPILGDVCAALTGLSLYGHMSKARTQARLEALRREEAAKLAQMKAEGKEVPVWAGRGSAV